MEETGWCECGRISVHPHDDFGAKSTLTRRRLGDASMKRIPLIVFWVLAATVICSAQTTFYYPHVANGVLGANIWKTTIFLTNPAASGTASGTITFSQENTANLGAAGSVFGGITFVDQDGAPAGSGGTITFSIPGGQTRK